MFDDLLMNFLNDKEASLKSIFTDIDTTDKYAKGLEHFLNNIDNADMTEPNIRKKFKTLMKVINDQNSIMRKLLFINLIYMQGDNFNSDVAKALIKMGRGDEAIKSMFNNKMKGNKVF